MTTPAICVPPLADVIRRLHSCEPIHVGAIPVEVVADNDKNVVWQGDVQIFTMGESAAARHCYAWEERHDNYAQLVVVPAIPPISSAQMAVRSVLERRRSGVR